MSDDTPGQLDRAIGIGGAMFMGLGSIVGTGVFISIGIGASVAGSSVIVALAIAAVLAMCNGISSAQLAAAHPVSGGTYEYGYKFLSAPLGFLAGTMFMVAKSASAATAALGCVGYIVRLFALDAPEWTGRIGAPIVVLLITVLVLTGIRRSNLANTIIVSTTLLVLGSFVVVGTVAAPHVEAPFAELWPSDGDTVYAVLSASALMFVAYTGYGRIATLGEEVKEPRRTIPIAVVVTLLVAFVLYVSVAIVAILVVGADKYAELTTAAAAPLELIARSFEVPGMPVVLAVGAVTAMLGVLLNLVLGLSRVLLAMGRRRDVPPVLGKVSEGKHPTPVAAVIAVGVLIGGLTLLGDVKTTWTFSALTVLVYYGITNLAALKLPPGDRRFPRFISVMGLVGCLGLAFFIEPAVWIAGGAVLLGAAVWFVAARRLYPTSAEEGAGKGNEPDEDRHADG